MPRWCYRCASVTCAGTGSFPQLERSIQERSTPLGGPGFLVRGGERIEIGRLRGRVVDPFAQQLAAVDYVEGELVPFVLVVEMPPDAVIRPLPAHRLQRERD